MCRLEGCKEGCYAFASPRASKLSTRLSLLNILVSKTPFQLNQSSFCVLSDRHL
ncbi:unnamed protein product [Hymenolepis diminuta]|uniref:Uncharacterized protein n=1 Tax=Hymenolepis diminuta TaxID=6216 RepID=A0A564XUN9_HYMDI|nr:unnamed protein product [Hymenolepis diminuta]